MPDVNLREELSHRWPCRDDRAAAEALNVELGLSGDFALDASLPPVWFVGGLEMAQYLLIGVNPGRGKDGDPSWEEERGNLSDGFDHYWDSRITYFRRGSYNWRHYGRTGTLMSSLAGRALHPREALASLCVQVEMVPFFSKNQNLSEAQVTSIRRDTAAGEIARKLLGSCLDNFPNSIVFRGGGGALDALLAENDGRLDRSFPGVGSLGWLRSSSDRPLRLITLSGAWSVSYESIRALAAASRGETVDWPRRESVREERLGAETVASLYADLKSALLALSPDITIRPRSGGLRSEAFRVRRNFARIIEHSSWLEVHLLDGPGRFRTDFRVMSAEQLRALGPSIADAFQYGS